MNEPHPIDSERASITPPRSTRRLRLRRQRSKERASAVRALPTLLTLGNLMCGFAAIHYVAKPIEPTTIFGWNTLTVAGTLIFLGMFFDGIDGFAARLTRSASSFGAQLDSLADVVTFGVAPAFMMLRLVSHYYGPSNYTGILGPDADSIYVKLVWIIAAFYVCCTALRLARFNVEIGSPKEEDHRWFAGLPSPVAGGTVASLIILHQHMLFIDYQEAAPDSFERASSLVIPLVTLACGIGMVSRLRYAHLVNRYLKGRKDFAFAVRLVLPLAFAVVWFHPTMAAVFTIYALSGPIGALVRRQPEAAPTLPS